jgi:hypothetical protein
MFRFDSFNKKTDDDDAKSFLKRFAGTEGRKKTINTSSFSIPMPTNSWGMLALSRLQEDSSLDDIVELLLNKDKVTIERIESIHIDSMYIFLGYITFASVDSFVIVCNGRSRVYNGSCCCLQLKQHQPSHYTWWD